MAHQNWGSTGDDEQGDLCWRCDGARNTGR